MMPTLYRPKDEPWPGGRGVYDWRRRAFVPVVRRESAGVAIEQEAVAVVVPRRGGSCASACARYGSEPEGRQRRRTL